MTKNTATSSRTLHGSLSFLTANIYFVIASYGAILLLARSLTIEEFGYYSLVISLIAALEMVICDSFAGPYIKALAVGDDREVKRLTTIQMSILCGTSLLMFVGSGEVAKLLNNPVFAPLLKIGALDLVPFCLLNRNQVFFNGRGRPDRMTALLVYYSTGKLIFMSLGGIVFHDVGVAIFGMVLASAITGAISFINWRSTQFPVLEAFNQNGKTGSLAGIMLTAGCALFYGADIWIAQAIGSPAEVLGLYSAAHNLSKTLFVGAFALALPILPVVARQGSIKKAISSDRHVLFVLMLLISGVSALLVIFLLLGAGLISLLFGSQFVGAYGFLLVLAPAHTLIAFTIPAAQIVFQSGFPKETGRTVLITALAYAGAGYLLGLAFGPRAAPLLLSAACCFLLYRFVRGFAPKTAQQTDPAAFSGPPPPNSSESLPL